MRRLLLALLALITIGPMRAAEDKCNGICGRRPLAPSHSSALQFVGGINTLPGTWPWMVSIRTPFRSGYQHTCGGSLIGAKWILTAAHCFKDKRYLTNWELVFGATELSRPGPDAQLRFFKRVVEHENYQPQQQNNDIALIELDDPIQCNDYIQPACLPESSVDVSAMVHCYIAGWGYTQEKSTAPSDILKEAKVDLIPIEMCNSSDWYYGSITAQNLCAGFAGGGIDSCQGDSGGPLMCREGRSERYWVVGVTSWGLGCARAQKPGVYTSTRHFYDWIRGYTKPETPPKMTTPLPRLHLQPPPLSTAQPQRTSQMPTTSTTSTQTQTTSKSTVRPPPLQPKPLLQTSPPPETTSQPQTTSQTETSPEPNPQPPPHQPQKPTLLRFPQMPPPSEAPQPVTETTTKSTTTSTTRPPPPPSPPKKPERRTMVTRVVYGSRWDDSRWPSKHSQA
ncbi:acrosin-like [Rhineura floridana]|uniref:acrosin-like n=1 Tax=Rhineura floridana TaxID=261503 RepID=UPI002AC7FA89|nr:acrosin-like [Rhineura floridana]